MKRVPYKCKFGHVVIKEYYSGEATRGSIICGKCEELAGTVILYPQGGSRIGTKSVIAERY